MNLDDLEQDIAVEFEALEATVRELLALQHDVGGREPSIREKTAAGAFLAQFYSGIENILKRITRYHDIPLPTGETWHIELLERFCQPSYPGLPSLFDESLASALAPYRRFRHVVLHGYGFQLDWNRMAEGVANTQDVLLRIKKAVPHYLETLNR